MEGEETHIKLGTEVHQHRERQDRNIQLSEQLALGLRVDHELGRLVARLLGVHANDARRVLDVFRDVLHCVSSVLVLFPAPSFFYGVPVCIRPWYVFVYVSRSLCA